MEIVVLLAQTALTFWLAAWLFTGVLDNILYPEMNETFTAQVLSMARLREDYPDDYALIAHRRIENPRIQRLLFRFIVFAETLAVLVLAVGTVLLGLAVFGIVSPETARPVALMGALLFTSVWSGFLVAGNWFAYWYCHEWSQNTHYQMTLWGLGTMIFLVVS
ncbi:MAG: DUF2165 family protein [Pseudomonadota bacterium]